jgi:hypothetical protein
MSLDVFKRALKLCREYELDIAIGGGEPTIHPLFWDMLGAAIVNNSFEGRVWLATNGKKTKDALRLANLAKDGIIVCELSQDEYHEPIDYKVIEAFTKEPIPRSVYLIDYRGVRNTTLYHNPVKSGRCKTGTNECICPDIFVKPNGDIYQCGCKKSPKIGDVFKGVKSFGEIGECYSSKDTTK